MIYFANYATYQFGIIGGSSFHSHPRHDPELHEAMQGKVNYHFLLVGQNEVSDVARLVF